MIHHFYKPNNEKIVVDTQAIEKQIRGTILANKDTLRAMSKNYYGNYKLDYCSRLFIYRETNPLFYLIKRLMQQFEDEIRVQVKERMNQIKNEHKDMQDYFICDTHLYSRVRKNIEPFYKQICQKALTQVTNAIGDEILNQRD